MDFNKFSHFQHRHLGTNRATTKEMLKTIKVKSVDDLVNETVPKDIRLKKALKLAPAMTEQAYLTHASSLAAKNKIGHNFIGQGYYGTITPAVILRNIFQNPAWYTQYTPYQAEISQGRLEALLNFQTVVSDLTGLPIANASLLDEGTATAEAMSMFHDIKNKKHKKNPKKTCFVDRGVFNQTIEVLKSRALPLEINIVVGDFEDFTPNEDTFAIILQYPTKTGAVIDYAEKLNTLGDDKPFLIVVADLLSLAILKEPAQWGADAVVGNTQRFGVPMGFGGPHAAYFATHEKYKRMIPGRIIGISQDILGNRALRMALQTREQHIRREKATSNICTAQALLAIMAGMYAVYHGEEGIRLIAQNIYDKTSRIKASLATLNLATVNEDHFDTLTYDTTAFNYKSAKQLAVKYDLNLFFNDSKETISFSIDEAHTEEDLLYIINYFEAVTEQKSVDFPSIQPQKFLSPNLLRTTRFLTNEVFVKHHTETSMMRYIKALEQKDISLVHSMIPLGSCTMKLNAATELFPVSYPEFSAVHPFTPENQVEGYLELLDNLEAQLCEITGFTACSLQPNSGASGELAGLLCIRAYHLDKNHPERNVALIPASAHGTNPASAIMAGMKVVVVACDDEGNINHQDLKEKAEKYKDTLSCLIVTYPSTHGVYEEGIKEMTAAIHNMGGLVYMDGANMNAQIGWTNPNTIGADVCHLNLHKTFAIPHGGGGPGVGPILVNDKLKPYLPGKGNEKAIHEVASAKYGSASVSIISYGYICLMGADGLRNASSTAIFNANYLKEKLAPFYPILYVGKNGHCAHEFILDLRPWKQWVSAEDVAKRLIDYGFHAPTLSFPVTGTIMIEPTESESLAELDRFADALIQIKSEIIEVEQGMFPLDNNVLHNAPHTLNEVTSDDWKYPYARKKAAYPVDYLHQNKFWVNVKRVNNAYGDRHLVCTCPPMENYMEEEDSNVPVG